jgi:hypothetical protein
MNIKNRKDMLSEEITNRKRVINLWWSWIIVNIIGGIICFVCVYALNKVSEAINLDQVGIIYNLTVLSLVMSIIGFIQWTIIKRILPRAIWWPIITILLCVISWLITKFLYSQLSWVIPTCSLYIGQYLLIHKKIRYSPWWILIGIVFAVIGYFGCLMLILGVMLSLP